MLLQNQQRSQSKKGQIAVEMFIALGIMMFLFLSLVILGLNKEAQLTNTGDNLDRRDVCIALQTAISSVLSGGPGTSYSINISLDEQMVVVENSLWIGDDNLYSCPIPINVGNEINLTAGIIEVVNINNNISIQNV